MNDALSHTKQAPFESALSIATLVHYPSALSEINLTISREGVDLDRKIFRHGIQRAKKAVSLFCPFKY